MSVYNKIRAIQKLNGLGVTVPRDADAKDVAMLIKMVTDKPMGNSDFSHVIIDKFLAEQTTHKLPAMSPLKPVKYPPDVEDRLAAYRALPSLYE